MGTSNLSRYSYLNQNSFNTEKKKKHIEMTFFIFYFMTMDKKKLHASHDHCLLITNIVIHRKTPVLDYLYEYSACVNHR